MNGKHLHIVTHDVPYPVDFGGVFDLFHKIRTLHAKGLKIHLHCFTYKRPPQPELEQYCESVNYYPRERSIRKFSFSIPFIVNSRSGQNLISNLLKDDHPVLLEGIHCTYPLYRDALKDRKVVVRLHNVEYAYYHQLARNESNLLKKWYYQRESRLLKKYEAIIAKKSCLLAVSKQDVETYRHVFGAADIHYLPVFTPFASASGKAGKGCFCLYHGNLSVNENERAALWLLKEVFSKLDLPLVIAGKGPSAKLEQLAHRQQNTCLVADPSEAEMADLVDKAHVHILPSFNNTGVKLKLLNALANGRHCLVNAAAVAGSGLEGYCHIAVDASSFADQLTSLYDTPFTEEEIQKRKELLQREFNNEVNADRLMQFL